VAAIFLFCQQFPNKQQCFQAISNTPYSVYAQLFTWFQWFLLFLKLSHRNLKTFAFLYNLLCSKRFTVKVKHYIKTFCIAYKFLILKNILLKKFKKIKFLFQMMLDINTNFLLSRMHKWHRWDERSWLEHHSSFTWLLHWSVSTFTKNFPSISLVDCSSRGQSLNVFGHFALGSHWLRRFARIWKGHSGCLNRSPSAK